MRVELAPLAGSPLLVSCLLLILLPSCPELFGRGQRDFVEITVGQPFDSASCRRLPYGREVEEKLGIRVRWVRAERLDSISEIRVAAASKNLPDVLLLPPSVAFSLSDLFLPLDLPDEPVLSLLKREYPLVFGWIRDEGGNIRAVPIRFDSARAAGTWMIREDWLKNLILPFPRLLGELTSVLKGFRYGSSTPVWVNRGGVANLVLAANLFGTHPHHYLEEGRILWGPSTESFKEALIWLGDLYAEGIIDPQFPVRSDDEWESELMAGRGGFTHAGFDRIDWFRRLSVGTPEARWRTLPPPRGAYVSSNSGQELVRVAVVTRQCSDPSVVLRWLSYYYGNEGRMLTLFGKEGRDYAVRGDRPLFTERHRRGGRITPSSLCKEGIGGTGAFHLPTRGEAGWLSWAISSPAEARALTEQAPFLPPENALLPPLNYGQSEADRIEDWTAILTPVWESYWIRFINGDLHISEWERYLAEVDRWGMKSWTELLQATYDRIAADHASGSSGGETASVLAF